MGLTDTERSGWEQAGYFFRRGLFGAATIEAMMDRIVELTRAVDAGADRPDLIVGHEQALARASSAEGRVSKVFRVMRTESTFRSVATDERLLSVMAELIGPDVDCFLSQFIFKHPGSLGQPWHQDDYYFRMTPLPQVGVWVACTEATADNGPLWIVPGSHREGIHDAVPDPREGANPGYVEIVGADTTDAEAVLMEPGDVLVFHSHLRHMSTDNRSDRMRAAMVYHYASAHTAGHRAFNQDWVEVLRAGRAVRAPTEPVAVEW